MNHSLRAVALAFGLMMTYYVHAEGTCDPSVLMKRPATESDHSVFASRAFAEQLNFVKVKEIMGVLDGTDSIDGPIRLNSQNSPEGREILRRMVMRYLDDAGLRPELEVFADGANVVVEAPGTDLRNEVVEVVANLSPNQGAQDPHLSGASLLIELAAELDKARPRRTVRFVFLDGKNSECGGACSHLKALASDPRQLVGSIVVDSIGAASGSSPVVLAYPGEGAALSFAQKVFYPLTRLNLGRGLRFATELAGSGDKFSVLKSYWSAGRASLLLTSISNGYSIHDDNYRKVAQAIAESVAHLAGVPPGGGAVSEDWKAAENVGIQLENSLPARVEPSMMAPQPVEKKKPKKKKKKKSVFDFLFGGGESSAADAEDELAPVMSVLKTFSPARRVLIVNGNSSEALLTAGAEPGAIVAQSSIPAVVAEFKKSGGAIAWCDRNNLTWMKPEQKLEIARMVYGKMVKNGDTIRQNPYGDVIAQFRIEIFPAQ